MRSSLVLASVALAFSTPAAAAELITNGGFETGDFTGFTLSGNTGFTFVTTEAPAVSSGLFGAAFGPVGSLGTITQTLATSAGQSYLISFDLSNLGGETPNAFNVSFGGTSLFSATDSAAFAFTNFSTTATAAGASTDLAFSFQHDPNFFTLDNISVTAVTSAVPEPTTWALMILGLGFVGGTMRSARRQQKVKVSYA